MMSSHVRNVAAVLGTVLLAHCGGGASDSSSTSPTFSSVNVQPQTINFTAQSGQQATVTISGGTAPYSVRASDPRLVSTSSPVARDGGASFTITPIASGTTTIRVTDASAASEIVSVSTPTCEPPVPETFLSYPATNASGVTTSLSQIWVADPNSDPGLSIISSFAIRLLGSDGSTISGGNFATTSSSPPPGSAPPPSGPSYAYATSNVSGLQAGLTYQIQEINVSYPCIPPAIIGQFTT